MLTSVVTMDNSAVTMVTSVITMITSLVAMVVIPNNYFTLYFYISYSMILYLHCPLPVQRVPGSLQSQQQFTGPSSETYWRQAVRMPGLLQSLQTIRLV